MAKRTRYQYGSVEINKRITGPDVWLYRWWESTSDGRRTRRGLTVGTIEQYKTEAHALKAAEGIRFAVDRLRFQAISGFDSTISGWKAFEQIEDGVLGGRSSDRKGLHSGTEEMAIDLSRFEGAMALPEPDDRSSVSRRFDSCRLPCSHRSPIRTRQDRVSHVPPHLPRLAGRNRSTSGRATKTHATRARFYNDGPVWKCLGYGEAQGQSANCATTVEKVCQSAADRDSINKGNCEAVPLIGQFWTVTTL